MPHTNFVGNLLKFIIVSAAAIVTGWIGLAGLFSDIGPNENVAERVATVTTVYIIGCGIIGALLQKKWYIAIITTWGPILISIFMLVVYFFNLGTPANTKFFVPFWISVLFGFPIFSLIFGFIGAWLCRKLQGHHKIQKNIQDISI